MRGKLTIIILMAALVFYSLGAYAGDPIKIIVNEKELHPDVPAQIIDGRTMVPIRFVAEALGLEVKWDSINNTVIISSQVTTQTSGNSQIQGLTRNNPFPKGETMITPDGFGVGVTASVDGEKAWNVIYSADIYNSPPAPGYKYILIRVTVQNISNKDTYVSDNDFALVGSSNVVFKSYQQSVVLPKEGPFKELSGNIYHGEIISGALHFYIPKDETNLVLIWDKPWNERNKRFFKVE